MRLPNWLLLPLCLTLSGAPALALSPAGTTIVNRASGSYVDAGTGFASMLQSNSVDAVVQPLEAVQLAPNQAIQNPAGAPFSLAHRLENVGNTSSQFKISVQNQPGDDYDALGLKVFHDVNDNGVVDAGEPEIGALSPSLPAGTSISLVINGSVPAGAVAETTAKLQLSAISAKQGASAVNTDLVSVTSLAALQVTKAASVPSAKPDEFVTWTVTALNRGNVVPQPINVIVDGTPRDLVVLRDLIPLNTGLMSVKNNGAGIVLYHLGGDAANRYSAQVPPDLELIDAIAIATPRFEPHSTLQFVFTTQLHRNASGDIRNTAQLLFSQGGNPQTLDSNQVRVAVPRISASLLYYTGTDFQEMAPTTGIGDRLFIQANAPAENRSFSVRDVIRITIKSLQTGDVMTADAVESQTNSGLFRVVTAPIRLSDKPGEANNAVETRIGDQLTSFFVSQDEQVSSSILVDPFGVVYDSRSNAPVAGARVTLIDVAGRGNGGRAGQSAEVFQLDGTPAPSAITTGADGRFQFPRVRESTYRLQIEAPAGFTSPSKIPAGLQPAGRIIDASGSYGGNFNVTVAGGAVQIDVPLDSAPAQTGLFVEKIASRRTAEIGDFLDYEIRVRNTTLAPISAVSVVDTLPNGFRFQPGTARSAGQSLVPRAISNRQFGFDLGTLAAGAETRFSYRVLIGVGSKIGKNLNTARALATGAAGVLGSNLASASVEVQGGVFDEKGIILGRVFADSNRDGVWQAKESGIPGVRIYLEDGTFIITDEDGKYSIYGLEARTHVVKIDPTTLPRGARFQPLSARYGASGQSYFIDLKKGELHKVNFAEITATPEILAQIKTRRALAARSESEAAASLRTTLTPDGAALLPGDTRALPASGMIGAGNFASSGAASGAFASGGIGSNGAVAGGFTSGRVGASGGVSSGNIAPGGLASGVNGAFGGVPASNSSPTGERVFAPNAGENAGVGNGLNNGVGIGATRNALPLNSNNSNLPTSPVAKVPSVNLEALLPTLSADLGFVDLKNGDTLALSQANVRVKGAAGSSFKLRVNGIEIPATRVGLKTGNDSVTAWEFVGVKMKLGKNELQVEQIDSFGLARGNAAISVIAPGDLGRLEVSVPAQNPFADGRSLVKVGVRLSDAKGTAVSTRTALTLEASLGQWQALDLNPREPGVQVFLEGGRGEFALLAPLQAGNGAIRISSGVLEGRTSVAFVPELRPLFASGLATAKLNLFGFKARGAGALRTSEIFENEDNARAALFVKGRILGKNLLTLRYDSQRREDDRLFRDIQPDAYYPIYGDAGARGFDAQSTGKLYVRVDDQKSYVLYGDYTTSSLSAARGLGDYNRAFTGFKLHREVGKLSANVFASRDNQRQIVDEIRGNGTSGRYLLRAGEIREQSERVEIIVRDRNQPSVILSTTPQTRFLDYTLDNFAQGLVFRAPVPSFDANLNPVFIRVSYEVEQGGPKFLAAGADAQYLLSKNLEIGGAYTSDRNPQTPFSLRSLNVSYRFAPNTTLVGEWAQSSGGVTGDGTTDGGRGGAQRVELLHEGRNMAARLFWGRSDAGFNNPSSLLSQGREEAALKTTLKVNDSTRLIAEAIRSKDSAGGATRLGGQIAVQRSLQDGVKVEIGVRKVKDSGALVSNGETQAADFTSLRAKVSAPVPNAPQANLFAEYERAVQGSGQVLALGGDYQIANRGRVYLRHEFISSLSGRYGLNDASDRQTTLFGIDGDYMKNGRVFSEYRVGGGINGRDAQASIGLRNNWNLSDGVRLQTTFERIKDMGGLNSSGSSVAATGALEYTRRPDFKGTARLEVRRGATDATLATLGAAYKVNPALTLLGKGIYSRTDSGSGVGLGGGVPAFGVNLSGQNQERAIIGLAYRSTRNDRLQALLKYEFRGEAGALAARLRRRSQIASANVNYQAGRKWNLSGRYALKSVSDASNGLSNRSMLQLYSGRATYNMGRRSDLSLVTSYFHGGGASEFGAGAEVGFRLASQIRLSAGYLLGRYRGDGFAPGIDDNQSDSGFYLRFGYEFGSGADNDFDAAGVTP